MIFATHDISIIKKILPLHCESYLEEKMWTKRKILPHKASIWQKKESHNQTAEILLPLDTEGKDYINLVIDFLETLKIVEQRPLEAIVTDLLQANTDTVRITVFKGRPEISLPLKHASDLIDKSIKMISATAQSIMKISPYYYKYSKDISDLLDKIKMGHTERGSFIISIHVPVSPRLTLDFGDIEDEPFERKVIMQLARLIPLAVEKANTRNIQEFEGAIDLGLSANFCDALSEITEICGDDGATFDIAWAVTRPIKKDWKLSNSFLVRPDIVGTLKEAAMLLRNNLPLLRGVQIKGFIVRLDSTDASDYGEIRIIESETCKSIFAQLDAAEYKLAITAHKSGDMVELYGDLETTSRKKMLTNITKFELLTNSDFE